jgi:hypothetical protein
MVRLYAVPGLLLAAVSVVFGQSDSEAAQAVLQQRCSGCHSRTVSLSGLDLSSRDAALKGGTRGPSVIPGKATESRLIQLVSHVAEPAMPPTGRIPDAEIAALRNWIDSGFEWSGAGKVPTTSWWAFRNPVRPQVPQGPSPVDAFINRTLRQKQLEPAPEADKLTLIRRATFDLHGLPPSPQEVEQFLGDKSPEAWSRLIDRLLASPRYGERWGRHWLDLVRYGDTAGFETDPYHLDAWRYRDYVIRSFNSDKPYDLFIREQLAGDDMGEENFEAITATGYFRVGPHRDLQVKVEEENRIEKLSDYVDTTSRVFLGLTVGCARCHDHKFDPIPQRDYYRMQAIFEPAVNHRAMLQPLALLSDVNFTKREFRLWQLGNQLGEIYRPYERDLRRKKLSGLDDVIAAFETPAEKRTPRQQTLVTEHQSKARVTQDEITAILTPADRDQIANVSAELLKTFRGYGPPPFTSGITDPGPAAAPSYVALRGNPKTPGEQVSPGFLTILGGGDIPPAGPRDRTTGRRKALADWIASPNNPLTARVMVNRIWQFHFGRGLLETSSDFGTRAGQPTHPELLDWLALEFMDRGWSVKAMHRLIMDSDAYRRSSVVPETSRRSDPENQLLSHFNRRRLSSDEVRDAILSATGELNLQTGGMPVVPPLSEDELYGIIGRADEAWPVTPDRAQHLRRSVYLLSRRTFQQPMFAAFDHPDGIASCARRNESTTAPQSLTLLNSNFMIDRAKALAARFESIDAMWNHVLLRTPRTEERTVAEQFLQQQTGIQKSAASARVELARVLLNLNEFLYVD